MDAANDNAPPTFIPIIGVVGDGGVVTITDPTWRPSPRPAPPYSSDPREA